MNLTFDKETILGGYYGLIAGDALGVPVEFSSRERRKADPVTGMRGMQAPYYQPAGTWSDDSSMMLGALDALAEKGFDCAAIMDNFVLWINDEAFTAHGEVFDIGNTCREAIEYYNFRQDPLTCGCRGAGFNGNGSLMRILPVSLWALKHCGERETLVETVHRGSALTHAHLISMMGCGIYTRLVEAILEFKAGKVSNLSDALQTGVDKAKEDYAELGLGDLFGDGSVVHNWRRYYGRLEDLRGFAHREEDDIQSGGFVVHTLEAAVWCLLTTNSYTACVLKAVNLGKDTDTTAAVAGSLAGLVYGTAGIPQAWLEVLARKEWLDELGEKLCGMLCE